MRRLFLIILICSCTQVKINRGMDKIGRPSNIRVEHLNTLDKFSNLFNIFFGEYINKGDVEYLSSKELNLISIVYIYGFLTDDYALFYFMEEYKKCFDKGNFTLRDVVEIQQKFPFNGMCETMLGKLFKLKIESSDLDLTSDKEQLQSLALIFSGERNKEWKDIPIR